MEATEKNTVSLDQMEIIFESNQCVVHRYEDEDGSLLFACHHVFPGIDLIYKDFRKPGCVVQMESPARNAMVIEHCREGRVECRMENTLFYLEAGDVTLRCTDQARRDVAFPMESYTGIDIVIDLEKAPGCLTCLMDDVEVEPAQLARKFGLEDRDFHFLRQNARLDHIFAEFYTIPESICRGYLKVKVLEVLLFLTGMPLESAEKRRLSRKQARLAKSAHQYLAEHMHEHITIAELARQFGTSQTQLKDSFRNVYGMSVQGFICDLKMRAAAEKLLQSDCMISEVASEFGYANASKFAAAFKRVMGCFPAQYRTREEESTPVV